MRALRLEVAELKQQQARQAEKAVPAVRVQRAMVPIPESDVRQDERRSYGDAQPNSPAPRSESQSEPTVYDSPSPPVSVATLGPPPDAGDLPPAGYSHL